MTNRRLFAILVFVAFAASPGWADERILDFHSDIVIHADSSMTVTEMIRVRSEGRGILHGIFRDFPTCYEVNGQTYTVGFHVRDVKLDRAQESYHIESVPNGIRVYIGRKDRYVGVGEHTYRIAYTTTEQLGFFDTHDELYWNVTGNGWAFPIDHASAQVRLPSERAEEGMKLEGYTGVQGAMGRDLKSHVVEPDMAVFDTTRVLGPQEGLTIVVGFPKGIVQKPSRVAFSLGDDLPSKIMLYGFVVVLVYYLAAWAWVGIDPSKGRILPRDTPPEGVSPAGMRLMTRMKFDQDVFRTAVVSMAVKGFLRIEHDGSSFVLVRDQAGKDVLAPEELAIAKVLFASGHEFKIRQSDYEALQEAIKACRASLRAAYERVYYVVNGVYFVLGLVLSIGVAGLAAWFINEADHEALFPTLLMAGWTCVVLLLCVGSAAAVRKAVKGGRYKWGVAVAAILAATLFLFGNVIIAVLLCHMTSSAIAGGIVELEVLVFAFYYLLKAPTAKGRQLLDAIEGYRLWLTGDARAPLAIAGSPKESAATFDANMPFALALGIEEEWSRQFANALARVGAPQDGYTPYWYRDDRYAGWAWGNFSNGIGSALQGAIASSSTAPGSSSGFSSGGGGGGFSGGGGGGSSGGGGGGGGGGGW